MVKNMMLALLCGCSAAAAQQPAVPQTLLLDKGWEFSKAGSDEWLSASVPGTVHQDLIGHGKLPDPFYGKNEELVQWVENEDWQYRTTFTVTEEQLQRDAASLIMEGLDTYADVYLNGSLLLKADNMFMGYEVPVKSVLRKGENRLYVYFHSPMNYALPQYESNGFDYPAGHEHAGKRTSVFTRKAPYSYGWDWGIRLATSGIWRPVSLSFYDVAAIDDYYVRQLSVSETEARVENQLEVTSVAAESRKAQVTVEYDYKGNSYAETEEVVLQPGCNRIAVPMNIPQPHLWMPNGWGEAALYTFTARVTVDGKEVACESKKVGLRTIEVVKEKDEQGESFYFVVNGEKMFAKGTNYVPGDALLPRVTPERYERMFEDIKAANMNMIRVWGGGVYEDDNFYEQADEKGILVWQDFMFACTTYPHDPAFLKNVEREAEYNIKRLRGHASLAMWCGNNEIYEGMRYWGWKKKYTPEVFREMERGYDALFRELLPSMVQRYDEGRFYMHGSPYEANWGRPESWAEVDSHNWGIWHGRKPFESLDKEVPRFMSEFGFQSFPEMKTIRTFAAPEDYALESEVMNAHQKSYIGNALIKNTMELYYTVPEKFEDLVYKGLVLQGVGLRRGMEAHRRNRPYCMGSLYWQFNDSWPVVSWSSIDYYGNWKAMHYQAQRAFAPVLVNAVRQEDELCCYLLSDRLHSEDVTLSFELMDFDGKVYRKHQLETTMPANASTLVYKEKVADVLAGQPAATTLLHMTLKSKKGEVLSDVIHYFAYPKDQQLPKARLKCKLKEKDGVCELTVKTDKLARDIFIEVPVQGVRFSDNFFDLLPGQQRTITIHSPEGHSLEDLQYTVHQLSDVE